MKENTPKGILLLVAASVLWSTSGVMIKGITWDGFAVAGFRSLIAALTMFLFIGKIKYRFTFSSVGAVIAYACTVTCIGLANKNTTAANAVLLQFSSPIYTALLGWWLLKERITKADVVSIVTIIFGMTLFVTDGLSAGHFKGDLLALIAGISFGSMCVFLRLEKDSNPIQCTFFGNILSFLICVPFIKTVDVSFDNVILISLLGIFQLGISYVLFTMAIRHVSALQANIIPVVEPLLNPVWVMLILHETPSAVAILGGIIVISGVIGKEIWNYYLRKNLRSSETQRIPEPSIDV
jgi:drug/metabolite transporter (DMT)-like permease